MTLATSGGPFERFRDVFAARLTTFKRDGSPVGTAVNIAVEGDHAYFRTFEESGKFKRLRRTPEVELAPSDPLGRPTGRPIRARARLLDGPESEHAAQLLDRKHRLFQGLLVRRGHRMRGYRTRHFELRDPAS